MTTQERSSEHPPGFAQSLTGDTSAERTEPGAAIEFARHLVNEDADIREGMRASTVPKTVLLRPHRTEPWCPEHGYGCEPQNCPCGHSLRCDCWDIANER